MKFTQKRGYEIYVFIQTLFMFFYAHNWLLRNPQVHYRSYINPQLVAILSKIYPVSSITTHLPQIHFNINLPSAYRPSETSLPLRFPTKILQVYAFLDSSICATCPANLNRPNYVRRRIQCMYLSIMYKFLHSPVISSLLDPNTYISKHFILQHP